MNKVYIQIIRDNNNKISTFTVNKYVYKLILILFVVVFLSLFGIIYYYSDYIKLKLENSSLKQNLILLKNNEKNYYNLKKEVIKLKRLERSIKKIVNTNDIKKIDINRIINEKTKDNELVIEDSYIKGNLLFIPNIMPSLGMITAEFSEGRHLGIDIASKKGTPIISTAEGEVLYIGYSEILGKYVIIKHKNLFLTKYAHCSSIIVKEKQKVKKGELIAFVGKSGEAKGYHLHYEILFKGRNIDPLKFLNKYGYLNE